MTQSVLDIEIHPQLSGVLTHELLDPSRLLWTSSQLAALTGRVARELTGPLHEILHFDVDQRWWARLALTDGVELWLLSWLPGQQTKPHDHGGAAGSFTVLRGEVTEEYRYPGGPIRTRTHGTGTGIGFGAGRAHQVTGAGTEPAATVHAYSPPLVPTREYRSLADVPAEIPPLPVILER
ncbi:cysteine dioxygenase family protein [Amycolatopsis acidiphila]|uniref:Cysteine dioxygenase n=1 Tax=Amycolatopsis acidiphila TaxID=715473 RepID=A0A558AHG0_9PSEU|nr:cysteine dioxygenase family protein [Amycolatopsis acidiphila]TVT23706.1 cysteine dioxygenase [Amycolatopsis acidiphila]UIJ58699.1 cysteine dioxygenase family protein [Amycolatopsis acidiphila]GHG75966.1 cysteine dioxygenase [Amycolatopsis acidiphila]